MENMEYKSTEELLSEIDKKVLRMAKKMKDEGYVFDLSIPNENEISLKVSGKEFTFTKIDPYTIKKDGALLTKAIEAVIAERIKEHSLIEKE